MMDKTSATYETTDARTKNNSIRGAAFERSAEKKKHTHTQKTTTKKQKKKKQQKKKQKQTNKQKNKKHLYVLVYVKKAILMRTQNTQHTTIYRRLLKSLNYSLSPDLPL